MKKLSNSTRRTPAVWLKSFSETERMVASRPELRRSLHHLRKAFEELDVDGVLCLDGVPAVYLKDFDEPVSREEVNALQRRVWNHGVATLLAIREPHRVLLLSAVVGPSRENSDAVTDHPAYVDELNRASAALEQSDAFAADLVSGGFYRRHREKFFDKAKPVDRALAEKLAALASSLASGRVDRSAVHQFLSRLIFACYLTDRGIIRLEDYGAGVGTMSVADVFEGAEAGEAARFLNESLFPKLRREFNGSLFEEDPDGEMAWMDDDASRRIRKFFAGGEIKSNQEVFGFWAFDFSVIPVETISSIYEQFLKGEDERRQEETGAYYTPRNLAELVVATIMEAEEPLLGKRVLDPSCGSGIFLVILFNRMAEEWRLAHSKAEIGERFEALMAVFGQLCGIDLNETACRITCFSLYIAFLDQFDPRDLRLLKQEVAARKRRPLLPPLMVTVGKPAMAHGFATVREGNYFDPEAVAGEGFDLIVGNPPWVSRKGEDAVALSWWKSARTKARTRAEFSPQDQIAVPFLWKVPGDLAPKGRSCLILPSAILLNKTDKFQAQWFSNFSVSRILHLADYRRLLFENASRPCFLLNFSKEPPGAKSQIEYFVPKFMRQDPRTGFIPVNAEDRRFIRPADLIAAAQREEAALIWKTRLWGTPRDWRLLDYLMSFPKLCDRAGRPGGVKRWVKAKGFQPWYQVAFDAAPETYGPPKPIEGKLSDSFVATTALTDAFLDPEVCTTLEQHLRKVRCKGYVSSSDELKRANLQGFRRSPQGGFEPPMILINKGFTKVSFSSFRVFYQDAVTGISAHSCPDDGPLLEFFTFLFRSKLAHYFQFHSAGSLASERTEVRVHELLRLPLPFPEDLPNPEHARKLLQRIESEASTVREKIRELHRDDDKTLQSENLKIRRAKLVDQLQSAVEPLLYEYFGLNEEEVMLIEDTCTVFKPSATPTSMWKAIPTLQTVSGSDLARFSTVISDSLNTRSERERDAPVAGIPFFMADYGHLEREGLAVVTLRRRDNEKEGGTPDFLSSSAVRTALERLLRASASKIGPFDCQRGIIHSTPDAIYIIRQDRMVYWTRTAALNTADAIYGGIKTSRSLER